MYIPAQDVVSILCVDSPTALRRLPEMFVAQSGRAVGFLYAYLRRAMRQDGFGFNLFPGSDDLAHQAG